VSGDFEIRQLNRQLSCVLVISAFGRSSDRSNHVAAAIKTARIRRRFRPQAANTPAFSNQDADEKKRSSRFSKALSSLKVFTTRWIDRMKTKTIVPFAVLLFLLADPARSADAGARYPTSDEAFYVLSCMELNGHDADGLRRCSCAINAVESQLPYDDYSNAELVFAMRQAGGERAAIFRDTATMKEVADRFLRVQAEANRQCFGASGRSPTSSAP
jgi:hypothetical protein